jgi:hypothetical protein
MVRVLERDFCLAAFVFLRVLGWLPLPGLSALQLSFFSNMTADPK